MVLKTPKQGERQGEREKTELADERRVATSGGRWEVFKVSKRQEMRGTI